MMNEDAQSLSNESQNFMWRLEGIMFEEETFFLKVVSPLRILLEFLSYHAGDKEGSSWPLVFLCPGESLVSRKKLQTCDISAWFSIFLSWWLCVSVLWKCFSMCYVKAWKLIYLSGQMVGSAAEVARFGVTIIVFRFLKVSYAHCSNSGQCLRI